MRSDTVSMPASPWQAWRALRRRRATRLQYTAQRVYWKLVQLEGAVI